MYLRFQWPRWLRTCKDKEAKAVEISSLSNAEPCIAVSVCHADVWGVCLSLSIHSHESFHSIKEEWIIMFHCLSCCYSQKNGNYNNGEKMMASSRGLQGSFIWSSTENKTVAQTQLGSPLWCRTFKEAHKHLQQHTWSSLFQPYRG